MNELCLGRPHSYFKRLEMSLSTQMLAFFCVWIIVWILLPGAVYS